MKKTYLSPAVVEYGSIADCTFATPGAGGLKPSDLGFVAAGPHSSGDGSYVCGGGSNGWGMGRVDGKGKNYIVLRCDKFGEYSHS